MQRTDQVVVLLPAFVVQQYPLLQRIRSDLPGEMRFCDAGKQIGSTFQCIQSVACIAAGKGCNGPKCVVVCRQSTRL